MTGLPRRPPRYLPSKMPREAEPSLNEREYVLQALQEGLRVDGRGLHDYRPVELQFGDEYGQTEAKIGKTRVAVRISCSVTAPFADRKSDGIFTISTEFSPMASPAFEIGRPTTAESLLSRLIEKTIRRSSALDTESLCLIAGSKCFHVRADVHVLAADGNLLDATSIALIAALQHFRRPDTSVEGEEVHVWDSREREPVKLSLLHMPLCVSLRYFEGGTLLLVDATGLEEKVSQGEVVISMNRFGEVCHIAKYGGVPIDAVTMLGWVKIAAEKVKDISKLITGKLAEDDKQRNAGGLMQELSAENDR